MPSRAPSSVLISHICWLALYAYPLLGLLPFLISPTQFPVVVRLERLTASSTSDDLNYHCRRERQAAHSEAGLPHAPHAFSDDGLLTMGRPGFTDSALASSCSAHTLP